MKKFAKLSLVASVALASTTFANAQALEEAVKNVDISGTMAVRYNDYENGEKSIGKGDLSSSYYKVATDLKSKVNNDVTANIRIIAGEDTGVLAQNSQDTNAKTNLDVSVSEINFAYTGLNNTTIILGKQGINTPFTVSRDSIGVENTGSGLAAITSVGPVDFTAAYFNSTNLNNSNEFNSSLVLDGSEDIAFIGANYNIGSANIDASYIDVDNVFDAYTVGLTASYNVAEYAFNTFARYTALDLENSDNDNSLFKIGVSATRGIFGAAIAYGETDKEGGLVGFKSITDTGMDEHWRVTLSGEKDASVVYASVNAQVTPKLNVALKYSDMERGSNQTDLNEIYVQTTYNMSKNLMTYVRFGQLDDEDDKSTSGRLHVQYSF